MLFQEHFYFEMVLKTFPMLMMRERKIHRAKQLGLTAWQIKRERVSIILLLIRDESLKIWASVSIIGTLICINIFRTTKCTSCYNRGTLIASSRKWCTEIVEREMNSDLIFHILHFLYLYYLLYIYYILIFIFDISTNCFCSFFASTTELWSVVFNCSLPS